MRDEWKWGDGVTEPLMKEKIRQRGDLEKYPTHKGRNTRTGKSSVTLKTLQMQLKDSQTEKIIRQREGYGI
jgi:hypothetical protein